jgi:hypothetical protein
VLVPAAIEETWVYDTDIHIVVDSLALEGPEADSVPLGSSQPVQRSKNCKNGITIKLVDRAAIVVEDLGATHNKGLLGVVAEIARGYKLKDTLNGFNTLVARLRSSVRRSRQQERQTLPRSSSSISRSSAWRKRALHVLSRLSSFYPREIGIPTNADKH